MRWFLLVFGWEGASIDINAIFWHNSITITPLSLISPCSCSISSGFSGFSGLFPVSPVSTFSGFLFCRRRGENFSLLVCVGLRRFEDVPGDRSCGALGCLFGIPSGFLEVVRHVGHTGDRWQSMWRVLTDVGPRDTGLPGFRNSTSDRSCAGSLATPGRSRAPQSTPTVLCHTSRNTSHHRRPQLYLAFFATPTVLFYFFFIFFKKKRLQHLSFAYGHPLHYSVRLSQA